MPISPKTATLSWPAHTEGQVFTTSAGNGLQDDLMFAFRFQEIDAAVENLGGSASGLTADTTDGDLVLSAIGGGVQLQVSDGGIPVSDSSEITSETDYTFVCCVKTPSSVPSAQVIFGDWPLTSNDNNFLLYMVSGGGSDITLQYLNGDGSTGSDLLLMEDVMEVDEFYFIAIQRELNGDGTSQIRAWIRKKDSEFIYDPGGYDIGNSATGDNVGQHQIGVAPNDDITSWEPDFEHTAANEGGATANTNTLFAADSGGIAFGGQVFCACMWSRPLSYQEIASLSFDPFRLFTDANEDVADASIYEGIDRYTSTGNGPPIIFGPDGGTLSGKTTSLPENVALLNPNLVKKGSWIQQSAFGAPGVPNFNPMMGYNPSGGPNDERVPTDTGSMDLSGLPLGYRRVDFTQAGHYSVNVTSGISDVLNIKANKLGVIDLENSFTGDSTDIKYESPRGYYPFYYIAEAGSNFGDVVKDADQELAVWFRPQFNETQRDLDEWGTNPYYANADAIVVPFYYNFYQFTNTGTDAKTRIDYALDNNHGGFEKRIAYCKYIADGYGFKFYPAIRVDGLGTWGQQDVFDSQMELAMRVGDALGESFGGIYIWGGSSAVENAGDRLVYWANEGEAAGLYMVPEVAQSIDTYQLVSGIYGQAVKAFEDGFDNIFFGLQNIVEIDDPDVKMELLASFRDTYNRFDNGRYNSLASAAKKLNQHVLNISNKSSINDFLAMAGYLVSRDWANLSAISGYEIDPIYVK